MRLIGLPEWVQSELVGRFGEDVRLADAKEARAPHRESDRMKEHRLIRKATGQRCASARCRPAGERHVGRGQKPASRRKRSVCPVGVLLRAV